jgi:glucose-1-phosphate adenylyltransferase
LNLLALVLAGGEGTRLHPLTEQHAKPALPFAAGRRIVDFVLSNLVNSEIGRICVLAQYKPESLMEHIEDAWRGRFAAQGVSIEVILPPAAPDGAQYKGTADAVYRNLAVVRRHSPDLVAVFAADHVYRMDVRQMVRFHRQKGAEATIAAVPVPLQAAPSFGILDMGRDDRVLAFAEKPQRPAVIPHNPGHAYASMGNYLFEPRTLTTVLEQGALCGGTDFGRDLLPGLVRSRRVFAYDFSGNRVPGVRKFEEAGYWRDVGTLESLVAARNDVLGPRPRFNLQNRQWPIHGIGLAALRETQREAPPHALAG